MEIRYKINPRNLVLAMIGICMVFSSYLIFIYDPVQLILRKILALSPGSLFFNLWSNPPYEVFIRMYIFNVTNSKEFLEGTEKLRLEQVGPYTYLETLRNTNATFNPNGTVTFYPKRFLKFVPEKSVGDPTKDTIISPNIPLLGIAASIRDSSMVTNLALASLAHFLGTPQFLPLTIEQYLWGYDDRLVELANTVIPSWIDFGRFGIMERLMAVDNATNAVTIMVDPILGKSSNPLLTEDERSMYYHIDNWNGFHGLTHWGYTPVAGNETHPGNTRCNNLEGSIEGTIFPPEMKENQTVRLYRRAFCRPVAANYEKTGKSASGFDAYFYRVDQLFLATPEENPDNACYCPKSGCLKKGLGSLAPCYYDIPITISQPHFLNSDPSLLEQVYGMKPNKTLHDSVFTVHPRMGVPMESSLRIQINLDVGETVYNSLTEPFNDLMLPLFWIELAVDEIPPFAKFVLTMAYHVAPVAEVVVKYLLGIIGLALISCSALLTLFFADRRTGPDGQTYSPIPIIPMASQYFRPDIRISK